MQPNILLCIGDDQRWDSVEFQPFVKHMDGHARRFPVCRVDIAVCQPGRSGLLTGQLGLHHGNINNGGLPTWDQNNTVAKWLQDAGYRTGMFGKYINGVNGVGEYPTQPWYPKPTGWDTWREIMQNLAGDPGPGHEHNDNKIWNGSTYTFTGEHQIDWLYDEVTSFMAGDEPWFCYLSGTNPHYSYGPHPDNTHDWAWYKHPVDIDEDVSDKPQWVQDLSALTTADIEDLQLNRRGALREGASLNDLLQRIYDNGSFSFDDTCFIYTGDNGLMAGEHRRGTSPNNDKGDPYEGSCRIPLVCGGPGFTKGTSTEQTIIQDVTKTITLIGGASSGLSDQAGVDLRDIQNNPTNYTTRQVLIQQPSAVQPVVPKYDAIVTPTRKLIRYRGASPPGTYTYEAYDLDTDPDELINWAGDGGRSAERDSLENDLDTLLAQ